jgi:3-methyl-2-oxobutanoate hydroxymethyltransferase
MSAKITISTIKDKKRRGEKITMVTAYDHPSACLVEASGIEMILVGDSLGMAVLGYDTTLPVTMEDMIYHTKAVTRGARQTLVVADMPFLSYHRSLEEAIANAGRLIQEAGAQAVKLEGGQERCELIKALTGAGIPVLAHIGLTPQSVHQLGGYKVQGKDAEQAKKLMEDAIALEQAGAFGVVLECVPAPLATAISQSLDIPTIGIGAGAGCDGQVLVWHDLLGITTGMKPRFVKQYANLHEEILRALKAYKAEVTEGQFPSEEHTFSMDPENIPKLY